MFTKKHLRQHYIDKVACNPSVGLDKITPKKFQDNLDNNIDLILRKVTAGTYSFCVCAMGAGGEDYEVYTLTVEEAGAQEETEPAATVESTENTVPTAKETESATTPATEEPVQTEAPQKTTPWWVLLLVGLGAAGLGVGVAIILIKKK